MIVKNGIRKNIEYLSVILVLLFLLVSCKKADEDLLERMKQMEDGGTTEIDTEDDDWIRQTKKDILSFSKIIDEKVEAGEKLGTYYKLIGLKYLDYSMFHLALESFEKALEIYPENPNVLYYAGLTSARLSKTAGSESERNDFIDRAVRYYKASMSLKSRFSSPMYGLAVLYVYELNQPELAIPLLETYNSIQKSSMNGRFLMAAALFASGKESKAIDVYNWIIEKSESDLEVESARNNRNNILRGDNNEY
ncbi:MAG: hypothetical protein PF518_00485 [Spirochaetaceae bacterium]|jgi:tetratricopeptide (TPR) repeat protein|nr:hypothetical protein [Spirochaetaceae bacterium]